MTHAWCQNIERDEAVRASEDKRQGPLPTLEEAIARAGQFAPSEAPPGPKCTKRDNFAEAVKRSAAVSETGEGQSGLPTERVTERRPPEPGGGGNVTPGLRTELVTLEVTHRFADPIASLLLQALGSVLSGQGESVFVMDGSCEITKLTAERDAAIRERGEAIRDLRSVTAERAKLEEQLESVACRAAAAETALEAAPAASGVLDVIVDMTDILRLNADEDAKHAALATLVEAVCPGWRLAPAASGAAGTEPVGSEVVAWGVRTSTGCFMQASLDVEAMIQLAIRCEANCVPLVERGAAPQPAKGWLTKKDLQWLNYLLQNFPISSPVNEWIYSLLGRSSPPEVVLPMECDGQSYDSFVAGWNGYRDEALKALAAAGVKVKEVGR